MVYILFLNNFNIISLFEPNKSKSLYVKISLISLLFRTKRTKYRREIK